MGSCDCIEIQWPHDELVVKYQYISDILIAFAYFSIPVELVYFVQKSAFFPYRAVLMQFGAFIVLCGATHFINLWTCSMHSKTVAVVMAIAKISCAFVSWATALRLFYIIPDLLGVKTRELFLKSKAEELDREMGLMLTQEETGRQVRMLTHEIRSTLDRHTILRTTLIELGRTLGLEECALWMPSRNGTTLQLSHTLTNQIQVGSSVSINLPVVNEVFHSARAMRIPCGCPLARIRSVAGRFMPPDVVAVRVPLLRLSNFQINDWHELSARSYAVMVLILPSASAREWHDHELELIEAVADQIHDLMGWHEILKSMHDLPYRTMDICWDASSAYYIRACRESYNVQRVAVALSHAALLEESMWARDQLMKQNFALKSAQQEEEMAIRAHKDFLAVMNHEMRTPMHATITLSSLLLETGLTPEQRAFIETVLKSSNLLATLTNDVLDLSRLEDGSLKLESRTFNLHWILREVLNLIKPIASLKKLPVTLTISPDLPAIAVGDEKRLLQTILNVVGNAVKFTSEGYVSVVASVAKPDSLRDWRPPEFYPISSDGHFYMQVQVKDSGCGILPQDIPHIFTVFAQPKRTSSGSNGVVGLGLAICKRFVNLMGGHIWIDSEGINKGTVATFIVKLRLLDNLNDSSMHHTAPKRQFNHGSAELTGHRPLLSIGDGFPASNFRYQRSL